MSSIHFKITLYEINSRTILRLPKEASEQLSSRGLVMVKGTINGHDFRAALEPDGRGSHWFEPDSSYDVKPGDTVDTAIEQVKDWTDPVLPADVKAGLEADAPAFATWQKVTPMARWEWIRWIRATNNPDTRAHHIEVARSKLRAGSRRPCCFNARMCSDFTVGKNGVLLEPAHAA